MVNIFSNAEFARKMNTQKTYLWSDNFYNDKLIARTKKTFGDSGVYNRNAITVYVDTIVSGIAEFGPVFTTFDNEVETIDGDVRFSTKMALATTVSAADELWLNCEFDSNGNITYSTAHTAINFISESGDTLVAEDDSPLIMDQTSGKLSKGTMYQVNSAKDALFDFDRIFILKVAGKSA